MKKKIRSANIAALSLLAAFIVLILLLTLCDVRPNGYQGTNIGLAGLNCDIRDAIGHSESLQKLSKKVGYASFLPIPVFALMGLYQWITRKSLKKVDSDLYVMAGLYAIAFILYILSKKTTIAVVNYRPVDAGSGLEPSFPSSHTLLSTALLGSAAVQAGLRLRRRKGLRVSVQIVCVVMTLGITGLRFASGVHWLTDIIGGLLLGGVLVYAYKAVVWQLKRREKRLAKKAAKA